MKHALLTHLLSQLQMLFLSLLVTECDPEWVEDTCTVIVRHLETNS